MKYEKTEERDQRVEQNHNEVAERQNNNDHKPALSNCVCGCTKDRFKFLT
jgi:hypothetical protein